MSGKSAIENVGDLGKDASAALLRFGLALADTKYVLGRRLSEWITGAPAIEAAVAAAAMTQDELGHARSILAMLRHLPGMPSEIDSETDLARKVFFNPRILNQPFASWIEMLAMFMLLDSAMTSILEGAGKSRLVPLRQRVAKILQEEHFHRVFCDGWLARFGSGRGSVKKDFQQALQRALPTAVAWFGPPEEATSSAMVKAGILQNKASQASEVWQKQASSRLELHGFKLQFSTPHWSRWDPDRREIPNAK